MPPECSRSFSIFHHRQTRRPPNEHPSRRQAIIKHSGANSTLAISSPAPALGLEHQAGPALPTRTHLKRPPQCWHCSPTQPVGQTHWPVPGLQRPPLTHGRSHSLASAAAEPDTAAATAAASASRGSGSSSSEKSSGSSGGGGSARDSTRGRHSRARGPGLQAPVAVQGRCCLPFLPAGAAVAVVLPLSRASVAAAAATATIFLGLSRRPANTYTPRTPAPLRLAVLGGAGRRWPGGSISKAGLPLCVGQGRGWHARGRDQGRGLPACPACRPAQCQGLSADEHRLVYGGSLLSAPRYDELASTSLQWLPGSARQADCGKCYPLDASKAQLITPTPFW